MINFFSGRKKKTIEKTQNFSIVKKIPIIEDLIFSAYKFSFVKAIDIVLSSQGIQLDNISPSHDLIVFDLKNQLNFRSTFTDICNVEGVKEGALEIHTNLQGLIGIDGSIPDPYVEEYILYNKTTKQAVLDFYNIFYHRILSLRYLFCKTQVVECLSMPLQKSIIGKITASLSGFENDDINFDKSLIPHQFKMSAQNLFWRHTRSAEFLKIIVASFFDVDVVIEQFVGGFTDAVPNTDLSKIGAKNMSFNELGINTILGEKSWDSTMGITIHIQSLNLKKYLEFLPKASIRDQKFSNLQKLKDIIKLYTPNSISVKLMFHLDSKYVNGTNLNSINRLNKDAFILGPHIDKNTYFIDYV